MSEPFIKLIKNNQNCYFYDVNTNKIVKISSQSYNILKNLLLGSNEDYLHKLNYECSEYYKKGFLRCNQIKEIDRGLKIDELMNLLNTKLQSLLLQVTRDCNLRCKYCFYSGKYADIRVHEKKYMNLFLAKEIVDYFIQRTQPGQVQNVGFYGGEPLLNFELIKNTVKYIDNVYPYKTICYSITTNGLLLTPEIWNFLDDHSFLTTISIDGPRDVHDANRIFSNGKGSFDIIYKNIKYGFENHSEYYKTNIKFNAVVTKDRNIIEKFFNETPMFQLVTNKISDINKYHVSNVEVAQKENMNEKGQNSAQQVRMLVNILKSGENSYEEHGLRTNEIVNKLSAVHKYPLTNAVSAGLCIPGASRLFVTVNGDFYMCEKVDDNSEELKIGNVFSGWNETNIKRLANISNESLEQGCKNCWAINLCNMCAAKIIALGPQRLNQKCNVIRKNIEAELKNICILYEIKGEL